MIQQKISLKYDREKPMKKDPPPLDPPLSPLPTKRL